MLKGPAALWRRTLSNEVGARAFRPVPFVKGLRLGHRLPQTNDLVAWLELTALFKQFDSFEPLQNVALYGDSAGAFKAAMLGHKIGELGAKEISPPARPV
jgi:hypothetical protein